MKKKNLLYIFADQWRRSAIGYEETEAIKTPHFDQFAKENVYCTNAVSACPLCSPHRASLLTGKYPIHTGVFTNCKPELPIHLKEEETCIGDVLKQAGYRTGYIGKWHLDQPEERTHLYPESGAKRWDAFTPPGKDRHGFDFWYSYGAWDAHLHQHYWQDTPQKVVTNLWSPEHETNVAFDFLKQQGEEPFALFISWNPPHPPYDQVPQKYLDLYSDDFPLKANSQIDQFISHTPEADGDRGDAKSNRLKIKQYYAAISGLDEQFGRIIHYLKENNLFEDTYIVVSADHGDMMGAHGMVGKHVWYEESAGIPFILSGPDLRQGKCETVISSPDMMPTLLDLLQLPIPETVEGISCANEIKELKCNEEKVGYLGCYPGFKYYLEAFAKTDLTITDFGWRAIRTPDYTFAINLGYLPKENPTPSYYLYDLKKDPLQMNNKAGDKESTAIQEKLYHQLIAFMKKQEDGMLKYLLNE